MRIGVTMLLSVCLACASGTSWAKDKDPQRKPATKVTEKLSPQVYKQIALAQEALEAKDLDTAQAVISELLTKADKLNNYEQAQAYNFRAAIHYELDDTEATIADYIAILRLENVPDQLRHSSLFRLAQLYFVQEDYARSVQLLDRWMGLQTEAIRPEAHLLKAQALYQLEEYAQAKAPTIAAIREARRRGQDFNESWLALLRAIFYELGEYENATKVLQQLIQRWPKPSYYKQLSGMYGLMGEQQNQLYVMHAAYLAGMLDSESEWLNMARLYMAEDAPFPAIAVIEQGLEEGVIEETAANLQILAQAMALAQDAEGQIPVLQKAAELSGDAKQFMYLGQAQLAMYRWKDATASLQRALDIGGLDRPGSVHMQVGTAYFNQKKFTSALQAFKEARAFEDYAPQARQWISFVQQEIQRNQAMRELSMATLSLP
jgi:predicted Zn-dependent protease